MGKEYYIGLDVGTNSVGWATTDSDFNLLRIKGKTAWGSRIFDEAIKAEERRTRRTNKRRINRRKYRIFLLNTLFNKSITDIDQTFFLRLKNSNLKTEDKQYSPHLFLDSKKEKDFYKAYPTIWHLRNALFNGEKAAFGDIRNLYLAIHHIIKYRGNFLKEGEFKVSEFDFSVLDSINQYFSNKYIELVEDEISGFVMLENSYYKKLLEILDNKATNKTEKRKEIKQIINKSGEKEIDTLIDFFIDMIVGFSFTLNKILPELETNQKIQIDGAFDDNEVEYRSLLGENYVLLEAAKIIVDYIQLKELLGEHKNLSSAFVDVYSRHATELKVLKHYCKVIDKEFGFAKNDSVFFKMFKDKNNKNNYSAYVSVNSTFNRSDTDIRNFNNFVLKTISDYESILESAVICGLTFEEVKNRLIDGVFLKTIAINSTSLIPHQLHQLELTRILDNSKDFYPQIYELKEKILKLLTFRVPYYYGPLDDRSKYSSVVRKSNETITPWNIDRVIDADASKTKFINSLTNSCTYLLGETEVLPKNSILYQHFMILDRLNSMKINGKLITQNIKQELFELIKRGKKTSISKIKKYLSDPTKFQVFAKDGVAIDGVSKDDFINESYNSFCRFWSTDFLTNDQISKADDMIFLLTIYKDDINNGISELEKKNKEVFTDMQKSILKTLNVNGWAPFSKRLLGGYTYVNESGEVYLKGISIIDDNDVPHTIFGEMMNNVKNFQSTINKPVENTNLTFKEKIDEINADFISGESVDSIVQSILESAPAAIRRSTIQATRIVEEIIKFKGYLPKYISIEVTRENDKSKKGKETVKRQKEIQDFVKSFEKEEELVLKQSYNNIVSELTEENLLKAKGKHVYLYFKQLGLDMYTGKPIGDITKVLDGTYDIDHIVPRRLRGNQNSIDNLVLVNKAANQQIKKGIYPIPEEIRCNPEVRKIWKLLLDKKAISEEKYNALIRSTPLTDSEIEAFVNAQINVVNQSNIVLRNVLAVKYPDTQLIFSKSQYTSLLRQELPITKLRDLNDAHHAVDAYLNIISGVLLHKKYSTRFYLEDNSDKQFSSVNMEEYLLRETKKNASRKLLILNNAFRRDTILTYRNSFQDNRFYKETIYKAGEKDSLIPVHTKGPMSDVDKYGGYSNLTSYGLVVATIKGKKITRTLVNVPLLYTRFSKEELIKELTKIVNLKPGESVSFDLDRIILPNQKILFGGANYLLCTNNEQSVKLKPVSPIFLNEQEAYYLKKAQKYKKEIESTELDVLVIKTNKTQDEEICFSKENNSQLLLKIIELSKNKKYDLCPHIKQIREFNVEEFSLMKMCEQLEYIFSLLALFTRKSDNLCTKIAKNNFRISKTFINNHQVYLVHDSITGLQSFKKAL